MCTAVAHEQNPGPDTAVLEKGSPDVTAVSPDLHKFVFEAPAETMMDVFYPKLDPHFQMSADNAKVLEITEAISKRHPTNLLVTGQPGGGKTTLALQLAGRYNRPCTVTDFGTMQEPQQLFQTTYLVEGHNGSSITDIRESAFVRGMETPYCVNVLDELNRPENERVLNVLLPFLDGRASCYIEDLRRRVNVAEGVIFIATLNEGALFCGITSVDTALRDRFREIHLDYLPARQEAEVIKAKTGVPDVIANSLAEFAYTVRQTPGIGRKISTRQLLHAAEAFAMGDTLWRAVASAIGHYNDLSWRQSVTEIFSLNIKDEGEYQKWQAKDKDKDKFVKWE